MYIYFNIECIGFVLLLLIFDTIRMFAHFNKILYLPHLSIFNQMEIGIGEYGFQVSLLTAQGNII